MWTGAGLGGGSEMLVMMGSDERKELICPFCKRGPAKYWTNVLDNYGEIKKVPMCNLCVLKHNDKIINN